MHKFRNSTVGMWIAALLTPDSQSARGLLADARGQLHGNAGPFARRAIARAWAILK